MASNNNNNKKDGDNSNEQQQQQQQQHQLSATEAAIIEIMKNQRLGQNVGGAQNRANDKNATKKKHAFWDTQPMPHAGENADNNSNNMEYPEGPIVPNKPVDELRAEPYTMPTGFEWSNIDIGHADQRLELYDLLACNYVEDGECLFRFDYSQDFLLWALKPPSGYDDFLFGVRSAPTPKNKKRKLVAFISAIPTKIRVYDKTVEVVEINFLCVHKKLRSKRLAPVLIKEVTRRVNLKGIFQAVYTAGAVLPVPVSSARYYHRSLNPIKLINVGFSRLPPRMTMARMNKLYKLPNEPSTPGLRAMTEADVDPVHALLNEYLTKFALKILFTKEEILHWFLPRSKVINSYVVENPETKKITDFLSFYHLPSSILGTTGATQQQSTADEGSDNSKLFAAYSFYNVATSTSLTELMRDALILAKSNGADVFNALDLMENETFLQELKFGKGDGNLNYYIYNWACQKIASNQVGIVLL